MGVHYTILSPVSNTILKYYNHIKNLSTNRGYVAKEYLATENNCPVVYSKLEIDYFFIHEGTYLRGNYLREN